MNESGIALNFGGNGGPFVSGTWQNMNTGDVFVVRDQFFDGDQLMVSGRDGRVLSFNQLSNYIQISDVEMSDAEVKKIKGKPVVDNSAPPKVELGNIFVEGMLPDDVALMRSNPQSVQPIKQEPTPTSKNYDIIDKAFKGKVDAPEVQLKWENYPEKQISLLTEIMDIPLEDIAEYIYEAYVNNKAIMIKKIKDNLMNK